MHRHTIGIIGIALLVVGVLGAVALGIYAASTRGTGAGGTRVPYGGMMRRAPRGRVNPRATPPGGFTSSGQEIYLTGIGHAGAIPRSGGIGMMGSGGCVNCHGPNGRGGTVGGMMNGGVSVPDIRYSTMTSPHSDEATTEPGWSDAQIEAAIRQGKDPDGGTLASFMPRWDMDDTDMADLLAYLKELK